MSFWLCCCDKARIQAQKVNNTRELGKRYFYARLCIKGIAVDL